MTTNSCSICYEECNELDFNHCLNAICSRQHPICSPCIAKVYTRNLTCPYCRTISYKHRPRRKLLQQPGPINGMRISSGIALLSYTS